MSHDHGNTDENLHHHPPHHTESISVVFYSPTAVGGMAGGSETLDVDAHIIINTNPMDSGPKGHMDRIGSIGVGGVDVGADDIDGFDTYLSLYCNLILSRRVRARFATRRRRVTIARSHPFGLPFPENLNEAKIKAKGDKAECQGSLKWGPEFRGCIE